MKNTTKSKELLISKFEAMISDLKSYSLSEIVNVTGLPVSTTNKFRRMANLEDYMSCSTDTVINVAKAVDYLRKKEKKIEKDESYAIFFNTFFSWAVKSFVKQGTFTELSKYEVLPQSQLSKARKDSKNRKYIKENYYVRTIVAMVDFLNEKDQSFVLKGER